MGVTERGLCRRRRVGYTYSLREAIMSRIFRNACIAVAGLVMLLMGTSSALATVSIHSTTISATSSNSQMLILTQGSLTTTVCTSFRLGTVAIASSGAVTIPAGTVTFAGCRLNGNTANLTQASAWGGQVTLLLSGGSITGALVRIMIPSNGIRVVAIGCSTLRLRRLGFGSNDGHRENAAGASECDVAAVYERCARHASRCRDHWLRDSAGRLDGWLHGRAPAQRFRFRHPNMRCRFGVGPQAYGAGSLGPGVFVRRHDGDVLWPWGNFEWRARVVDVSG